MFPHCVPFAPCNVAFSFYSFDGFINPVPRELQACDGKTIILHYEACSKGHMRCTPARRFDFFATKLLPLFCSSRNLCLPFGKRTKRKLLDIPE